MMSRDQLKNWESASQEQLLKMRFSDLKGLEISGSWIEPLVAQLFTELAANKLVLQPRIWLSTDWFCPDGSLGFAIPFFLVDAKFRELERAQMKIVEGETENWCMQLLRHEMGHVIDNAFRLREDKERVKLFGNPKESYPLTYLPKPYSQNYVRHLEPSYAQSHPDEDFAESFAVWLDPKSNWRKKYPKGLVRQKLDWINKTMRALQGKAPLLQNYNRLDPLSKLKYTLASHYRQKKAEWGVSYQQSYDSALNRLFCSSRNRLKYSTQASDFIKQVKAPLSRHAAKKTGQYKYVVDQVVDEMRERACDRNLFLKTSPRATQAAFAKILIGQTRRFVRNDRQKVVL